MATLTHVTDMASPVLDRFTELEHRLNDHIEQEVAQEDYHEEIGRQLRVMINHHSDERRKAMEEMEAQFRERTNRGWAAIQRTIKDEQRKEFTRRNIAYAAVPAAIGFLFVTGGISLWLGLTGLVIDAGLLTCNIVAYTTRNNKKGE